MTKTTLKFCFFSLFPLTLLGLQTKTVCAFSLDPNETDHHEPSHQYLHCLQFILFLTEQPLWNNASD